MGVSGEEEGHTFCGNLVTMKANLSLKSSPKLPEYFQIQRNSEHY